MRVHAGAGKRVAGWVSWGGWVGGCRCGFVYVHVYVGVWWLLVFACPSLGLFLDRFDAHNVGLLPLGRLCLHAVCTDALMLGGFDLKSGA